LSRLVGLSADMPQSINPHPDKEYNHQRKPNAYHSWSKAFQRVWDHIRKLARGQKTPLITINVSRWAEELNVSRKTIQRFLTMLTTPGSSGRPLALTVKRPGKANQYKVRWDFTLKRKQSPDDPEPCSHRSEAHNQKKREAGEGGATFSLNNPLDKKKKKNTKDSKGISDPINWNRMMFKFREKLQNKQLVAVLGKFLKQRNYHNDNPARIRYFWTQLDRFIKTLKEHTGQTIRDLYHDIMDWLHRIMVTDYNTARERARLPWSDADWQDGSTSKIEDLINEHLGEQNETNKKDDYEKELEERNQFEKNRQQQIKKLMEWDRNRKKTL
jgi:hypothetical protein